MAPLKPPDSLAEILSWWQGRFDLLHVLEVPSMRLDPTIKRLDRALARSNPDLRDYLDDLNVPRGLILGYQALADTPFGLVRLAALFPVDPFSEAPAMVAAPVVLALDGPRESKHRFPVVAGTRGSARLCLYYPNDPLERRWTAQHGVIGLFDLARQHLACEHVWRRTCRWPMEDAPHGATKPARSRPTLYVPPARAA